MESQLDSLATFRDSYILPFNKDTAIRVIGLNGEETLKKKKERIIRYVPLASILQNKRINV